MHLLIIYYNFPPVKVPGAVRAQYVYEQSIKHFDNTSVITSSNRKYYKQDGKVVAAPQHLYEVPAYDLRFLLHRFRHSNTVQISNHSKKNRLYPLVSKILDSFPFNILIGDGGIIYILKAYNRGKYLVNKHNVTHLFSTFRPYSDHIVSYLLKRKYPHLYWIADFRDLHIDEKHGRQLLCWPLQVKINQIILCKANVLVTVSKGLAKKLAPFHKSVKVIPNGISNTPRKKSLSRQQFQLTYTGRIYTNEQDASLLFHVVSLMISKQLLSTEDIRLRYAGPTPELWFQWAKEYELEHITEHMGFITREMARNTQAESAINISLSFSSQQQQGDISSKIYEYLGSGRPILKIINGVKDEEIEHFFNDLQAGLLIYNSPDYIDTLEVFLLEQYTKWKKGEKETWPKNQNAYESLKTENIFKALFNEVTK